MKPIANHKQLIYAFAYDSNSNTNTNTNTNTFLWLYIIGAWIIITFR